METIPAVQFFKTLGASLFPSAEPEANGEQDEFDDFFKDFPEETPGSSSGDHPPADWSIEGVPPTDADDAGDRCPEGASTPDIQKGKHNPFTHFPSDPEGCEWCRKAKMRHAQCRKRSAKAKKSQKLPLATKFAHSITLDHIIIGNECASRFNHTIACILLDVYSRWLALIPLKDKTARQTTYALEHFLGPQVSPDYIYSDNSKEIKKSCKRSRMEGQTRYKYSLPSSNQRSCRNPRKLG